LQRPNAFKILTQIVDAELNNLRSYRLTERKVRDVPVIISRTGYTCDLGYEIWLDATDAEPIGIC
jgi:aminomethyltransferase